MELVLWILVAVVAWFGVLVSSRLRDLRKEIVTIRQFLQKDTDLKLVSIPANALNLLEQLAESVLRKNRGMEQL